MTDQAIVNAVRALRDAYGAAGCPKGPPCHSATCLSLATKRVFWPVLTGEEYPLYCDRCAALAKVILEVLGFKYADEQLPPPAAADRLIELDA